MGVKTHDFDPYKNDQHAMALVKKFYLLITPINRGIDKIWTVTDYNGNGRSENATLNIAIVNVIAGNADGDSPR